MIALGRLLIPFLTSLLATLVCCACLAQASAADRESVSAPAPAPLSSTIETAFSPEGNAEALVIKIIQAAKNTIWLSAYSFTSPTVVRALINATGRGVIVAVVVDYASNILDDNSGKARIALNLLTNAGITVRTNSHYFAHHDKFIVVDERHVQTGSFNYSNSAAKRNSENVLIVWNNPEVAASYVRHWKSRFEQGIDYVESFRVE